MIGKTQQAILASVANTPTITISEMAEELALTGDCIRYHLKNYSQQAYSAARAALKLVIGK